jgi:nitric oxide reductase activation protein
MKPERSEQYKEQKYLEHRQSLVSKILFKEKRQFDCFRKPREILHASHDGSDVLVAGLEKLQLYCNFKNET